MTNVVHEYRLSYLKIEYESRKYTYTRTCIRGTCIRGNTMTYQLKVNNLAIKITKLDTDEYEFTTTFKYLDYYGKSFIKLLSFIDDFDGYLKNTTFTIDYFDKHLILCCSVPYSNKCELVQLNKPEASEYEELSIMIKQQDDIIRDLNRRLNIYEEKTNMPTLDLVYEHDTWYFDTASYMKKPGANMANVGFLMDVLNDQIKTHACKDTRLQFAGADSLDKLLNAMNNPMATPGGGQGYISPQTVMLMSRIRKTTSSYTPIIESKYLLLGCRELCVNDILPRGFYHYFGRYDIMYSSDGYLLGDSSAIDPWAASSDKEHPMNILMDTFKLKKIVAVEFEIPRETIRYKRVPGKLNGKVFEEDTQLIKSELQKIIKKHGYPTRNMRITNQNECIAHTYIIY